MRSIAHARRFLLLAIFLLAARAASAEPSPAPPPRGPAYELTPALDVPALAITGVAATSWFLSNTLAPPWCAPRCDPESLPGIDRFAAGNYSPGWKLVSDIGLATILLGSASVVVASERPLDGLNDAIVVAESMLFANALAVISNYGAHRPRPFVFGEDAPLDKRMSGNAAMSFFSGHTASSFAVTISTFVTLRRLNRPVLAGVQLGIGLACASLVGISRVGAGDHFPTDVLAGAVVGASFGVLVPALHKAPIRVLPSANADAGGVMVLGRF